MSIAVDNLKVLRALRRNTTYPEVSFSVEQEGDGERLTFHSGEEPLFSVLLNRESLDILKMVLNEPRVKEPEDNLPQDKKPRLYLLEDENPEFTIPVLTDNPQSIRWDVGSEDHGGMPYEDFARVCDTGTIRQIKSKKDLPKDLWNCCPYIGGRVDHFMWSCRELCDLMDEDGVINLEE